ncbi:hypothetical protein QLX67_02450 [Balneolaceae bacterium ANBcel3]|nr:hypothetical protein [Balneolaceae bacterium ANBcel3]
MRFLNRFDKEWKKTRVLLNEARTELLKLNGTDAYIAEYDKYLVHNELELALDMLEEAATRTEEEPPEEIWLILKKAAESMGLDERCPFYLQQLKKD